MTNSFAPSLHVFEVARDAFCDITVNSLTVTGGVVKFPPGQFLHSNPLNLKNALLTFPEYVWAISGVRPFPADGYKIQNGGRKTGSCVGWMVVCCVWRFLGLLRVSFSRYFESILLILLNNKPKTIRRFKSESSFIAIIRMDYYIINSMMGQNVCH